MVVIYMQFPSHDLFDATIVLNSPPFYYQQTFELLPLGHSFSQDFKSLDFEQTGTSLSLSEAGSFSRAIIWAIIPCVKRSSHLSTFPESFRILSMVLSCPYDVPLTSMSNSQEKVLQNTKIRKISFTLQDETTTSCAFLPFSLVSRNESRPRKGLVCDNMHRHTAGIPKTSVMRKGLYSLDQHFRNAWALPRTLSLWPRIIIIAAIEANAIRCRLVLSPRVFKHSHAPISIIGRVCRFKTTGIILVDSESVQLWRQAGVLRGHWLLSLAVCICINKGAILRVAPFSAQNHGAVPIQAEI
ncbi:hypothetical protein NPIL_256781, partial [Nephila pilipes]